MNDVRSEAIGIKRIIDGFCYGVFAVVVVALVFAQVRQYVRMMVTGEYSMAYPWPYYGILAVPGTSAVASSPGALGADFSQVYYSAMALRNGDSPYEPHSPDFRERLSRRPNYPPLTNWVYIPFTYLPYHRAVLVHNFATILLFLGISVLVLVKAGMVRYAGKVVIVSLCLYFLTPIGISHFERGQFDLFVASSIVLAISCVFPVGKKIQWAVASGLLGALKWSVAPFLLAFNLAAFVAGEVRRRWIFAAAPIAMLVSTVVFLSGLRDYWPSLLRYEINAVPEGLSLEALMPRVLAKMLPGLSALMIIVIMFIVCRDEEARSQVFESISMPFAIAEVLLGTGVGTISYEYRTVGALGLIPGLVLWTEKARGVSIWIKGLTAGSLGVFLVVAFRIYRIADRFDSVGMTKIYLLGAVYFLVVCVYQMVLVGNLRCRRD